MKIKKGQGIFDSPAGAVQVDFKSSPFRVQGDNPESVAFGLGILHSYQAYTQVALAQGLLRGRLSGSIKVVQDLQAAEDFFRHILGPYLKQNLIGELDAGSRASLSLFCKGFHQLEKATPGKKDWLRIGGLDQSFLTVEDVILFNDLLGFFHWWMSQFPRFLFMQKASSLGVEDALLRELFPKLKEGVHPGLGFCKLGDLDYDPGLFWGLLPLQRRGLSVLAPGKGRPPQALHQVTGLLGQQERDLLYIETVTEGRCVRGWQYPGIPAFYWGDNGQVQWGGQPVSRATVHPVLFYVEDGMYASSKTSHELIAEGDGRWRSHFGPLISQYTPKGWSLSLSWARPRKAFPFLSRLEELKSWDEAQKFAKTQQGPAYDWFFLDKKGQGGLVRSGLYFDRSFEEGLWVLGEGTPGPGYLETQELPLEPLGDSALILSRREGDSPTIKDPGRDWARSLMDEKPERDLLALAEENYSPEVQGFLSLIRSYLPKVGLGSELGQWGCRLFAKDRQYTDWIGLWGAVLDTIAHTQIRSNDFFRLIFPENPSTLCLWEEWNWIMKKPASLWWKGSEKEIALKKSVEAFSQGLIIPQNPLTVGPFVQQLWGHKYPIFQRPHLTKAWIRGGVNTIKSFWVEQRGGQKVPFGTKGTMTGAAGYSEFRITPYDDLLVKK
jgi:hypothetical protein